MNPLNNTHTNAFNRITNTPVQNAVMVNDIQENIPHVDRTFLMVDAESAAFLISRLRRRLGSSKEPPAGILRLRSIHRLIFSQSNLNIVTINSSNTYRHNFFYFLFFLTSSLVSFFLLFFT